jgi:Putative addiction module component
MQSVIDIKHLSKEEKLQVMEALWEELTMNEEELESPAWHQKALQETESRISAGQEKAVDWQTAKKKLRDLFE